MRHSLRVNFMRPCDNGLGATSSARLGAAPSEQALHHRAASGGEVRGLRWRRGDLKPSGRNVIPGTASSSFEIDFRALAARRRFEGSIELGSKLIRAWTLDEAGEHDDVLDWFTTEKLLFNNGAGIRSCTALTSTASARRTTSSTSGSRGRTTASRASWSARTRSA